MRKAPPSLAAALALGLLLSGAAAAIAVDRNGSPGADRMSGTRGADDLGGGGGRDTILGRGGPDRLSGGKGRDRLLGGARRDRVRGGNGPDFLIGGGGRDRLVGGPGRDEFNANGVSRAGAAGNDVILARDGRQDLIECGPGKDTAVVDKREDGVYDCETIREPAP